jgi:hypothetical protein
MHKPHLCCFSLKKNKESPEIIEEKLPSAVPHGEIETANASFLFL